MKKCPFCAEEIQEAAIKCKHCGEFLNQDHTLSHTSPPPLPAEAGLPWYFRKTWILIVILSIPPLGLPMVWMHPRMPLTHKIYWTLGILALSCLVWLTMGKTWESYQILKETLEGMRI